MSVLCDIAVALAEGVGEQNWPVPLSVEWSAIPPEDDLRESPGTAAVTIVPAGWVEQPATRGATQRDCRIHLALRRKLVSGDNAEMDEMIGLLEAIAAYVRSERKFGPAFWVGTEDVVLYIPEHISGLRQYTGILPLVFRLMEQQ